MYRRMLGKAVDGLEARYRAGLCAQVGARDPGKLERVLSHAIQQGEPDVAVQQLQREPILGLNCELG